MSHITATVTRTITQKLLRCIAEGDTERIAGLFAQQVDWKRDWPRSEHGSTATPWIRERSTRGPKPPPTSARSLSR